MIHIQSCAVSYSYNYEFFNSLYVYTSSALQYCIALYCICNVMYCTVVWTKSKMTFRWGPYKQPSGDCAIYSQPTTFACVSLYLYQIGLFNQLQGSFASSVFSIPPSVSLLYLYLFLHLSFICLDHSIYSFMYSTSCSQRVTSGQAHTT